MEQVFSRESLNNDFLWRGQSPPTALFASKYAPTPTSGLPPQTPAGVLFRVSLAEEFWIKPEQLREGINETWYVSEDNMHPLMRDISKEYYESDMRLVMLGFENQTSVDKSMVFRVMAYDSTRYLRQFKEVGTENRKRRIIVPVLTCVLFFGYNERWTGPKTIHELVSIPPGFEHFVADYEIKIIELAWLTESQRDMLTGDLRIIADALYDLRTQGHIVGSPIIPSHLEEVFRLLRAVTNNTEMEIPDLAKFPKGERTMVNLMQEYNDKLRKEGYERGYGLGYEQAKRETNDKLRKDMALNMLALGLDMDVIRKVTELTPNEIQVLSDNMNKDVM